MSACWHGKNAVFSMPAAQPSAQNGMERLLDTYMPLLKAAEPAAAAAYFSSWFGGVALAFHYFISRNKGPDLSLGNITVQLYPVGNYHRFSFQVGEWQEQDAPLDPKERDRWRERMFTDFFYGKTVRPLFEAASGAAGIHITQLWGSCRTNFFYFMEGLAVESDPNIRERAPRIIIG